MKSNVRRSDYETVDEFVYVKLRMELGYDDDSAYKKSGYDRYAFSDSYCQSEYRKLVDSGVSREQSHYEIEMRRSYPQPTNSGGGFISGSDRSRRSARTRGLQEMSQNDPDKFDQYKRQAQAAGVDISGKTYCSGIAAYPGDPDGWVKDDNDIKTIAKMKGIEVSKEDGLLKLTIPTKAGVSPSEDMLARKRITKATRKKRIPRLLKGNKAGNFQ